MGARSAIGERRTGARRDEAGSGREILGRRLAFVCRCAGTVLVHVDGDGGAGTHIHMLWSKHRALANLRCTSVLQAAAKTSRRLLIWRGPVSVSSGTPDDARPPARPPAPNPQTARTHLQDPLMTRPGSTRPQLYAAAKRWIQWHGTCAGWTEANSTAVASAAGCCRGCSCGCCCGCPLGVVKDGHTAVWRGLKGKRPAASGRSVGAA